MKKQLKKEFRHMTPRTFLPVAIAAGFGAVLLIALAVFLLRREDAGARSQQELVTDYQRGLQYERGDNVAVDHKAAMQWYEKAAAGGYAPAELSLGIMYMSGRGVDKDQKQADDWFRRAAEHGLAQAQVQLAGDLLTGTASPDGKPDKVEALKWLLLGADRIEDPLMKQVALNTRAALAKQTTPDQQAEAERRAAEWRKQHSGQ